MPSGRVAGCRSRCGSRARDLGHPGHVSAFWGVTGGGPQGPELDPRVVGKTSHADLLTALVRFAVSKRTAGYRPGRVEVCEAAEAEFLRGPLGEAGIAVALVEGPPSRLPALADFAEFMRNAAPGLEDLCPLQRAGHDPRARLVLRRRGLRVLPGRALGAAQQRRGSAAHRAAADRAGAAVRLGAGGLGRIVRSRLPRHLGRLPDPGPRRRCRPAVELVIDLRLSRESHAARLRGLADPRVAPCRRRRLPAGLAARSPPRRHASPDAGGTHLPGGAAEGDRARGRRRPRQWPLEPHGPDARRPGHLCARAAGVARPAVPRGDHRARLAARSAGLRAHATRHPPPLRGRSAGRCRRDEPHPRARLHRASRSTTFPSPPATTGTVPRTCATPPSPRTAGAASRWRARPCGWIPVARMPG